MSTVESSSPQVGGPGRNLLFVSCAPVDQPWLMRVLRHLKIRTEQGRMKLWSRLDTNAGDREAVEVGKALQETRVALLLISQDYLASDEICVERETLLAMAESGELKLLWLPLRSSGVAETEIAKYKPVHTVASPIAAMSKSSAETVLVRVAELVQAAYDGVSIKSAEIPKPASVLPWQFGVPTLRMWHLVAGASMGIGVIALGTFALGLYDPPQVTCTRGGLCRANRPLSAEREYLLCDGSGAPVGLATVHSGWLRPNVLLDVPDPLRRSEHYRLRELAHGEAPPNLTQAGLVFQDVMPRLNLGQRHGLRKGTVYTSDSGCAIVVQVDERSAQLQNCVGVINAGRVRQTAPHAMVEDLSIDFDRLLTKGNLNEAALRQKAVECLDTQRGSVLQKQLDQARGAAAGAKDGPGKTNINATVIGCDNCAIQTGEINVMKGPSPPSSARRRSQ